MSWIDPVLAAIEERFADRIQKGDTLIVRDEKTLSGRVHVGSLRGLVLHGVITQALNAKGINAQYKFELNDADPMDAIQAGKETMYEEHMGKPLFTVPSPDPAHKNFPSVWGDELVELTQPLKLPIAFYPLRPLYEAGKFNDVIIDALNHAAEIRKIYKDVSGSVKPDDWYPLQVICESCGKIGTTQVTGWDGANVMYECKKNMVKWAQGCGNSGTISPFDGRAKLPWKVEWPAKWKVMKVDIEGAGKDHSAAGGSRQIGARISEEIFKYPNPFDIPYEFFNFKGKKMSASKGLGASAKEMADLLPPTQLKFLMIRKQANHPIDFDPEGATIPNLFDEFDRLSDHYFGRVDVPDPQLTRTFALANINFPNPPLDLFRPRFSLVSFIVQMPHLDLIKEVESIKGKALTEEEKSDLSHRAETAKRWLERYASPAYLYRISSQLPDGYSIDGEQRKSLQALVHALSSSTLPWEGVKIHEAIHHVKESVGIAPKKLFEPLYMLFLGRSSGPQLGWFLGTMQRKDVIGKIQSMVGTESI